MSGSCRTTAPRCASRARAGCSARPARAPEPERFAGQVAYTIPLRDLVRDPRVVIGTPDVPERSFGDRATDWLGDAFGWITSLIGLAIAAAVTALAGYVALEWWKRRRPT